MRGMRLSPSAVIGREGLTLFMGLGFMGFFGCGRGDLAEAQGIGEMPHVK